MMMRALWLVLGLLLAPSVQAEGMGGIATEALLESAIMEQAQAELIEGARLEFVLPEGAPANLRRVIKVEHSFRQAAFATIAETMEGEQITFRGKLYAVIDVPVPTRPILAGETAKADDFVMRPLPMTSLGRFTVTDLAALEGQEVRRVLPEGRPVQSQSLQPARAFKRGEKLTLVYQSGALEVTAPGRAMEDAALGAVLRVQNLNSSKIVNGIALGEGRVQVNQ